MVRILLLLMVERSKKCFGKTLGKYFAWPPHWQRGIIKGARRPGIELRLSAWKAGILPDKLIPRAKPTSNLFLLIVAQARFELAKYRS